MRMLTLKVFYLQWGPNDSSLRLLDHGVFSQMEHKYGEFSWFRESDKSMKYELDPI